MNTTSQNVRPDHKGEKESQEKREQESKRADGERAVGANSPTKGEGEGVRVNGEVDPSQHLESEGGVPHKVTEDVPMGHDGYGKRKEGENQPQV